MADKQEEKNFDGWNTSKKNIHNSGFSPLFRAGEIWWCALGINIGVEADGKNAMFERPILIIKKFNKDMLWGLPLTSREKIGVYYSSFFLNDVKSTVALSQLRILSAHRLIRKMGKLSDHKLELIRLDISQLTMIDWFGPEKQTEPLRAPRVPYGN